MSRHRPLLAALAAVTLLAAGCGDDDADAPDATAAPPPAEDTAPDADLERPPGEQPPEGVAASVGATEIAEGTVDDLVDALLSAPQVTEQLADQDDDQIRTMLRAEVLTQLVVQEVIVRGAADDYGIEVTDDELDAAMDDLIESVGGEDALDAQLESAGLTRAALVVLELPLTVALGHLQAEFGVTDPPAEGDDLAAELSEEELALQSWGAEKLQEAEVAVASDYGRWNGDVGRVEPEDLPVPAPGGVLPEE